MNKFNGFYQETIDFFIEITFNNNKEWFHANKDRHVEFVKQPISLFAEELFEKMSKMDKNFKAIPKISRINRDIRFSKDKSPYKNAAWFFSREDGSPSIKNEKPSYFFEIGHEGYRYGLSYTPVNSLMRDKMDANISEMERHIKWFAKQKDYILEGDKYKRIISKDKTAEINDWYQRKALFFVKYRSIDKLLFSEKLVDEVFKDFKKFYDLYNYFYNI